MTETPGPSKAELTIMRRRTGFAQTMLERLREKNRQAEKAQEAKLLTLQAQLASMEVAYDEAERAKNKAAKSSKAPHYEATVHLSGEGN